MQILSLTRLMAQKPQEQNLWLLEEHRAGVLSQSDPGCSAAASSCSQVPANCPSCPQGCMAMFAYTHIHTHMHLRLLNVPKSCLYLELD